MTWKDLVGKTIESATENGADSGLCGYCDSVTLKFEDGTAIIIGVVASIGEDAGGVEIVKEKT